MSYAVEWGVLDQNLLKGSVRKRKVRQRDWYVEDWELQQAMSVANPQLTLYLALKLATGLRRGDLLRLTLRDIGEEGITVQPHKTAKTTGKRLLIQWDEEGVLEGIVNDLRRLRRPVRSISIFCNRDGQAYVKADGTANGFYSLWQRFMKKALAETDLVERFQERDLRAKTASDVGSLLEASKFLGHSSTHITSRVYRRKAEKVQPLGKRPDKS